VENRAVHRVGYNAVDTNFAEASMFWRQSSALLVSTVVCRVHDGRWNVVIGDRRRPAR